MAVRRMSGTVWAGQMQLDGGHVVTWTTQGAASLAALGWVADWRLSGPGTALGGRLVLRRAGGEVGPVSGVAGWPLVMALLPGLPILCDGRATFVAVIATATRAARSGSGSVASDAATCARVDGRGGDVPVPALRAEVETMAADAVQAVVTAQQGTGVPLVTMRLTAADRLVLTIHQAGAAMVPGMPATADSELDLPLSVLMGR